MNEQLQKLYRQDIESTNSDEHLDMPNKQVQRLILTKYAELIIRECCDFLKDTLDDQFAAEQLLEHCEFDN
jgi:hypothetical protein